MIAEIAERENLIRAFQRVESARGMAGVDGVSPGDFRRDLDGSLLDLNRDLVGGNYCPLPLLRIFVAGADGSPNARFIPTVRDRTAQAAVMNVAQPILDTRLEDSRFAHRTTRCVRHAARRVKELWDLDYRYVVNAEIGRFFEGIDQDVVMNRVELFLEDTAVVHLIEKWTRAEVDDGENLAPLERGIPLGSTVAHLLADLLLDLLDEKLVAEGLQMVRYGDDLVVLARKPSHGRPVLEVTTEVFAGLQLSLDPEGPGIPDFWRGLESQGFLFPGDETFAPFDRRSKPLNILRTPPPFDFERFPVPR